ncbi:MAG: fatty acid desaturase [Bdellovibrionales bacterium]
MYNPSPAVLNGLKSDIDTTIDKKAYFKGIATHCDNYKESSSLRSFVQSFISFSLFFTAVAALILSVQHSFWLGYALLLIPTSGLLVRLFIIQHDCGHDSYFENSSRNDFLGRFVSLFTWTPYYYWKRAHNIHHAGSGNLARRGYGEIKTLTVEEFKNLSKSDQRLYRLYRHPLFLLVFATPLFMIIGQRFMSCTSPFLQPDCAKNVTLSGSKVAKSIHLTNLSLALFYIPLGYFVGFTTLVIAYLPILILTCLLGGWLFYIQHQFEDTHWKPQGEWSYNEAALMGSSYYDLPKWAQWFSGNIGIHHVHHLNSSIPNYRLQECIDDMPELKSINRMTFKDSLQCIKWALWDEKSEKMIPFSAIDKV